MKNAGIRVRIERDLRDEFVETCKREGRQASDVLREFMRSYVVAQAGGTQAMLFERSQQQAANETREKEQ